jgi:hypothetical protein
LKGYDFSCAVPLLDQIAALESARETWNCDVEERPFRAAYALFKTAALAAAVDVSPV